MVKPDFEADDAIEFWDITNREDWGISELSQAGIKSRAYKHGPYSRCESLPHAFDSMVLNREKIAKSKDSRQDRQGADIWQNNE
jgi:Rieske 2Fe-2S family protein